MYFNKLGRIFLNSQEMDNRLIIFNIALHLDLKSLKRFCETNRKIYTVIHTDFFWQSKLEKDFDCRGHDTRQIYIQLSRGNLIYVPKFGLLSIYNYVLNIYNSHRLLSFDEYPTYGHIHVLEYSFNDSNYCYIGILTSEIYHELIQNNMYYIFCWTQESLPPNWILSIQRPSVRRKIFFCSPLTTSYIF